MSLVFITLILLTGYCILDKKAPKQVEGYLPKFAIAFMVTFTILNEAIVYSTRFYIKEDTYGYKHPLYLPNRS